MKKYISFSQLNQYCRCGMQYYFRYVMDLKVPPSASLIQGKEYHSALEENHVQKVVSAIDLPLKDLKDSFAAKVEESFKEEVLLRKEEKEKGKIVVRDTTITKGQTAIALYHAELAPNLQPLEVEKTFTVELGENLPPLFGILDLVTEELRVVDHKTASKSPSASEADNSMQLSAYALGYSSLYGALPESLELQYSVVTEKGNGKTVVLKSKRSADDVERFMNRLRLVVDGIRKGVFIPPEQGSWACGYCGYRDTGICKL